MMVQVLGAGLQHTPDRFGVYACCATAPMRRAVSLGLCCLSKGSAVVTTDGSQKLAEAQRHNDKLLSCTLLAAGAERPCGQMGWCLARSSCVSQCHLQTASSCRRYAYSHSAHPTQVHSPIAALQKSHSQQPSKHAQDTLNVTTKEGKQPALSASGARRRWTPH